MNAVAVLSLVATARPKNILQMAGADHNGIWKLYIYDDKTGQTGVLQDSWSLKFYYQ